MTVPIAVAVVMFAVMNGARVTIDLWPLPWQIQAPAFLIALGSLAAGLLVVVVAILVGYASAGSRRRRMRQLAHENERLGTELGESRNNICPNEEEQQLVLMKRNNNLSYESVFGNSPGFVRSYRTARGTARFLEVTGWGIVVVGVLIMVTGFATGGMLGSFSDSAPFFSRFLAMIPGAGIAIIGIWNVAFSQFLRAGVDTAELTRELLKAARDKTT